MKRPRGTGSVYPMKGSRFLWIRYYRDGKAISESSGTDKAKAAEALLRQRIAEVTTHNWVSPTDRRITVDDLYTALVADYRNNMLKSLEGVQQRWEWTAKGETVPAPGRLKKYFGGKRALDVTMDVLNKYVTACREAGLSNGTINRDLAALRRAFNLALRAGKIQKVPIFPRMKESAPRVGFVEESQYVKLADNAQELWLRALLATAYTFGFRKSELLNLRVRQVDIAARTIRLNAGETKSGQGRIVSMTQDVQALIGACVSGKEPDDYVFTRGKAPVIDFRERWRKLTIDAGMPGLLFHDLRRSGVRNMVRRGIPEVVAMKISGHKTRVVFDRYNIVSEGDLVDAALKIQAGKSVWLENSESLAANQAASKSADHGNLVN